MQEDGGGKEEDRWNGKVSKQGNTFTKHKKYYTPPFNTSLPSYMILSVICYH